MQLFYALMLGHLMYDFHWQGEFVANEKARIQLLMVVHVLTWAMLMGAILHYFHAFEPWKFVILLLSHWAADRWKCGYPKTPLRLWTVYVDQGVHLASLIAVSVTP